jgi:hypothetical protein
MALLDNRSSKFLNIFTKSHISVFKKMGFVGEGRRASREGGEEMVRNPCRLLRMYKAA